jgi:hypothetical protein
VLLFGRSRSPIRRRICSRSHRCIRILVGLRILPGLFAFLLSLLFLFLCQFSHAFSMAVVVFSQFGFLTETFKIHKLHTSQPFRDQPTITCSTACNTIRSISHVISINLTQSREGTALNLAGEKAPDEVQKLLLNHLGLTLPRRLRRIDEFVQMQ